MRQVAVKTKRKNSRHCLLVRRFFVIDTHAAMPDGIDSRIIQIIRTQHEYIFEYTATTTHLHNPPTIDLSILLIVCFQNWLFIASV